jgi:hypothetical protein
VKGQAAVRNRGLAALGVGTALTAVLLLVVLNAGASPPAPILALSCASSGSPCVLTAGGAGISVTFQNTQGKSTAALAATLVQSPANAGFKITSDACSGTALGPNKTCRVTVAYTKAAPTTSQTATLTVATKKTPVQSASTYFTVAQGNHAPIAGQDTYSFTAPPFAVSAPGVLENDSDADGDALTAVLVSGPSNGTLSLNSDGSFVYTPNSPGPGTDSFTYKANDGNADSNVATVTLNVPPPSTPTPTPQPTATPTP